MSNLGFSQVALVLKNLPANAGDARDVSLTSGLGSSPWRRAWQPTPEFLPGESHGQRSLVGISPWGCKELDRTEVTEQHIMHKRLIIFHSSLLILIVVQYRILRIEAIFQ